MLAPAFPGCRPPGAGVSAAGTMPRIVQGGRPGGGVGGGAAGRASKEYVAERGGPKRPFGAQPRAQQPLKRCFPSYKQAAVAMVRAWLSPCPGPVAPNPF